MVVDNHADSSGGGMWVGYPGSTTGLTLDHAVIAGNTSGESGGGMWMYASDPVLLSHVAVVGNDALWTGGGILTDMCWPTLSIPASIVADNSAAWGGGGVNHGGYGCSFDWGYSAVHGNTPADLGDDIDDPVGVSGNVGVPPGFADLSAPDAADWDLHLDVASYLIDQGDPLVLDPAGGASDIGPYGGPLGGGWDLDGDGYFEWWLPGPYDPATSPGMDCDDRDPTVFPGSGC